MIQFLTDKINSNEIQYENNDINFIDLGTGNGHLLFQLYEDIQEECDHHNEYRFYFKGIDYSPDSVDFAKNIANQKFADVGFDFEQVDLLSKASTFLSSNKGKYDVLLDKGTLDAIALNQEPIPDFDNKIGMEVYASQVSQLMHENSILLITSCNFTESELINIISSNGTNNLSVWDKIPYPSFQFGGQKGSTICSLAFVKGK